ncbi:MFS transporter [Pendulispora rubella]|uniref:MFS transporter n=1 Tax=Pendulispora rubella TaxID=2741070 RepID=A0ABZ2LG88_9BACT
MRAQHEGVPFTSARSAGIVAAIIAASLTTSLTVPPILPRMLAHFAGVPGVTLLVPLVVSLPLMISTVAAPITGILSDRFGRRPIVLGASALSAILGILPYWLDSLMAILVARALMGLTTGALLACTSALIGDFFAGPRRRGVLGAKYAALGIAHIVTFIVIGHLAATNWRNAFWIFLWGLVAAALVAAFIPRQTEFRARHDAPSAIVPWRKLAAVFLGVYLGHATFDVVLSGVPFLLEQRGFGGTRAASYFSAVAATGMLIGASSYPFLGRRISGPVLWCVTFGFASVGYATLASATSRPGIVLGTLIATMGCGLVSPNSLHMLFDAVPLHARGRVSGVHTVFFFLGLATGPLVGIGGAKLLGSSSRLYTCLSAALLAILTVYAVLARRAANQSGRNSCTKKRSPSARFSAKTS